MTARLRSMTGWAEATAEQQGRVLHASVRSVNHRFLDLRVHLPEGLDVLDTAVRSLVRARIARGHLDVFVRLESAAPPPVRVNRQAAALYLAAARELKAEFDLTAEPDLGSILRLPGVVDTGAALDPAEAERIGELLQRALGEALERLDRMREAEGRRLGEELAPAAARVGACAERIEALAERARPAQVERLRERMRELVGEAPVDPSRLAQEAAFAATRSDTTEETARLRSHLAQFSGVLGGAGEAGKKLDFLCQEMQREVNTILAKAPGLGADGFEITRLGLEAKAEIEKLREQVQNLE
jgi:uncharacterized protein (TIGR00255 family)